ncbi:sodium/myo-inositol cotransporter isoform X2 [Dasypus novemcinctus]|uniref:sodium/myo-inositol cotransporter isoform X2 n=1 Tax=Dasypus novemcinctus TaxID=9361 RepID=UPI00265ECB35|nr:small ribosomal subunit protein bS6m isoform X1 [Dasypus novemcinctus]
MPRYELALILKAMQRMLPTASPSDSPDRPSAPSPEPTPRLTRRERRRCRLLAHRMNQLTINSPEDPHQPQILRLLRLARAQASSTTPPAQNTSILLHILIIMLSLASSTTANLNYQPFNWTLSQFDKFISFNVTVGAPSFTLPFCQLAGFQPKHQAANLRSFVNCEKLGPTREETIVSSATGFYICPASTLDCQDPTSFFCPSWGCETIAYGWSGAPNKDPHLFLSSTTPLQTNLSASITFSIKNPNDDQWLTGRTWGARLYAHGHDHGSLFTIQKRHTTTSARSPAISPNQVLDPPKAQLPSPPPSDTPPASTSLSSHAPMPRLPFIKLINAAYASLNASHPNLT